MMGSVAERVVRAAPCPVLTLRSTYDRSSARETLKRMHSGVMLRRTGRMHQSTGGAL